jgi:hypothetical protein
MAWTPDGSRLAYDFSDRQLAALDALDGDADLVALLGGYRSGKSVTGGRWLLTQALEYPGTRHLAMGIDFAKAQGATYRVLFEQLPPVDVRTDLVTSHVNGPERSPLVADYNRSEHRLTLTNDSVIKLGAADVWNRYAGDSYTNATTTTAGTVVAPVGRSGTWNFTANTSSRRPGAGATASRIPSRSVRTATARSSTGARLPRRPVRRTPGAGGSSRCTRRG